MTWCFSGAFRGTDLKAMACLCRLVGPISGDFGLSVLLLVAPSASELSGARTTRRGAFSALWASSALFSISRALRTVPLSCRVRVESSERRPLLFLFFLGAILPKNDLERSDPLPGASAGLPAAGQQCGATRNCQWCGATRYHSDALVSRPRAPLPCNNTGALPDTFSPALDTKGATQLCSKSVIYVKHG